MVLLFVPLRIALSQQQLENLHGKAHFDPATQPWIGHFLVTGQIWLGINIRMPFQSD